ncbi:energy transducer TonB [Mucilaginibacter sp. E4BP6]|uniref:energy transducer TonB n=1 Tax=Mucilaginibacter sp. E4BP6 TaxID=2723089 RepID=UPI0015C7394F|nr:energy transducer TonB [Mucilaginibacter sp. E4BP6]NYE66321.1 TonB family protein [Mucilaginibacter sp. E4BP6]
MKKLLLILFLVSTTSLLKAHGQVISSDTTVYLYDNIKSQLSDDPATNGSFIRIPVIYPKVAMQDGTEGTVKVSFIIEKDGSISNIHIVKKVSRELDAETIRVIKLSPQWKPFILNGQPIRVKYFFSLPFKLNND